MSFIPHTDDDIQAMLSTIGIDQIDQLFSEIPQNLLLNEVENLPDGLNEMAAARLMRGKATENKLLKHFIGAGAYEHHIPAIVWDIAARCEFMTAYTPYQAEASQGSLQLLYEYQTMMAGLTGMEASNASMYDGGSSLAEAILMAVRAQKRSAKRILMPTTVHPLYRKTVEAIVTPQDIEIVDIPFVNETGRIDFDALKTQDEFAALVIPFPSFFGVLEDIDALTDWAHEKNSLVIAAVNPMALGLLKAPGQWGEKGVDIVCGEAQPLGIPLAAGGPYLGILCCANKLVRQLPGRIAGATTDEEGKPGYVLTLQAREQHIRRSKATSNICSNEGLMAIAATIYMSVLGPAGLKQVAATSHVKTKQLADKAIQLDGVSCRFNTPYFHEIVLTLPKPAKELIEKMAEKDIAAGFALNAFYEGMDNELLVCCTETKTDEDIEEFVQVLEEIL